MKTLGRTRRSTWYEVSMFFQTGAALPYGATSPQVQFVDNAVLVFWEH
jgi:hypothetical protein